MFDICTDVHFDSHMSVQLPIVNISDVIKTFFYKTKTLISSPRPRPSLVFKTKTKTKTFL